MHTHNNTGMETGTSAAAAGGSTTVIDMPLNSFPTTTTAEQLLKKMEIAEVWVVGVVVGVGWMGYLAGWVGALLGMGVFVGGTACSRLVEVECIQEGV